MREAEWSGLLAYLTLANIGLVLFNALPAFPLDGGRVLRALLALRLDYRRATETAARLGQALALGLGLLGFLSLNFFLIVIAVFVWFGAEAERQQVAVTGVLDQLTVGEAMSHQPVVLTPEDPLGRAVELTLSTAQADFPVVSPDGRVLGLLTADDLLRGVRDQPAATVGAVMRRDVVQAAVSERLVDVQQRAAAGGVRALLVVESDRLAGMLTIADIGEAFRLFSIRPELLETARLASEAPQPQQSLGPASG
jgi:CBS domain-containing protein